MNEYIVLRNPINGSCFIVSNDSVDPNYFVGAVSMEVVGMTNSIEQARMIIARDSIINRHMPVINWSKIGLTL